MGNIHMRNNWCVDNTNVTEVMAMAYFLGYVVYDFIEQMKSRPQMAEVAHHVVVILGALIDLVCGKYLMTLGVLLMILEVTTIFNNVRKLLTSHKVKEGLLFLVNGVLFALSFLVVRGIGMIWIFIVRFFPAYERDNFAAEDLVTIQVVIFVQCILYFIVCGLNFFWLFLIL